VFTLSRLVAGVSALALILAVLAAPASAVTATSTVTVAVNATNQATIGVTYSAGTNILCDVTGVFSGFVACTNTATLSGGFRSTKADTGGTSVSVTGTAITGSGGSSIAPTSLQMTCTGSATGTTYPGTAGTLATNLPLALTAVNCQSWTGTMVATYSLVASLKIDAGGVPADTYTNGSFTATATAN